MRRIVWQPMREISAAAIGATYQPLLEPIVTNAIGINTAARQFFIQNLTDQPVYISFNATPGVADNPSVTYRNLIIPSNGFFVSDITTNSKPSYDDGPALATATIVSVCQVSASPTTGSVYFSYWSEAGE